MIAAGSFLLGLGVGMFLAFWLVSLGDRIANPAHHDGDEIANSLGADPGIGLGRE